MLSFPFRLLLGFGEEEETVGGEPGGLASRVVILERLVKVVKIGEGSSEDRNRSKECRLRSKYRISGPFDWVIASAACYFFLPCSSLLVSRSQSQHALVVLCLHFRQDKFELRSVQLFGLARMVS